jgi:phosphate uptake regulator
LAAHTFEEDRRPRKISRATFIATLYRWWYDINELEKTDIKQSDKTNSSPVLLHSLHPEPINLNYFTFQR